MLWIWRDKQYITYRTYIYATIARARFLLFSCALFWGYVSQNELSCGVREVVYIRAHPYMRALVRRWRDRKPVYYVITKEFSPETTWIRLHMLKAKNPIRNKKYTNLSFEIESHFRAARLGVIFGCRLPFVEHTWNGCTGVLSCWLVLLILLNFTMWSILHVY